MDKTSATAANLLRRASPVFERRRRRVAGIGTSGARGTGHRNPEPPELHIARSSLWSSVKPVLLVAARSAHSPDAIASERRYECVAVGQEPIVLGFADGEMIDRSVAVQYGAGRGGHL